MKRVIAAASTVAILPDTAIAEISDWALVPVTGSDGDTNSGFFDTNTCLGGMFSFVLPFLIKQKATPDDNTFSFKCLSSRTCQIYKGLSFYSHATQQLPILLFAEYIALSAHFSISSSDFASLLSQIPMLSES